MSIYLILILLITLFGFNLYTNYYNFKNYLMIVYLNIFLSYLIYDRYNPLYALLTLYLLTSSSYYSLCITAKHFCYPAIGNGTNPNLNFATLKAYVYLVFCCLYFYLIPTFEVIACLKIAHVLNIILTFIPAKYTEFTNQTGVNTKSPICGFGANVSVNGTLLSLMSTTFLIDYHEIYSPLFLLLTFLAIAKTHATAGMLSFLASMMVYMFFQLDYKYFALFMLLCILIFGILVLIVRKINPQNRMLSVSGRDNIIRFTEKWIRPRVNKYTGSGVGSITYIFPSVFAAMESNQLNQFKIANYVWLHSDIYQFFIEAGIIGTLLMVMVILFSIYTCYSYSYYGGISFIVCYLMNSLINFPNHMVPDTITILSIFSTIGEL